MIAQQKVDRMTEGLIDKINAAKEERGISLRDLARESGVSLSGLHSILQKKTCPSLEMLIKITEPLGLSLKLVDES